MRVYCASLNNSFFIGMSLYLNGIFVASSINRQERYVAFLSKLIKCTFPFDLIINGPDLKLTSTYLSRVLILIADDKTVSLFIVRMALVSTRKKKNLANNRVWLDDSVEFKVIFYSRHSREGNYFIDRSTLSSLLLLNDLIRTCRFDLWWQALFPIWTRCNYKRMDNLFVLDSFQLYAWPFDLWSSVLLVFFIPFVTLIGQFLYIIK